MDAHAQDTENIPKQTPEAPKLPFVMKVRKGCIQEDMLQDVWLQDVRSP